MSVEAKFISRILLVVENDALSANLLERPIYL